MDVKTEDDWASLGLIDLATNGLFLGNAFGLESDSGTWSGTITLTYDDVGGGGSECETWSVGASFANDNSGDGVANGIAFLLGAELPGDNALGLLPESARSTEGLVLSFSMRNAASRGPAVLNVQWSNDLGVSDSWEGNHVGRSLNGISSAMKPMENKPHTRAMFQSLSRRIKICSRVRMASVKPPLT